LDGPAREARQDPLAPARQVFLQSRQLLLPAMDQLQLAIEVPHRGLQQLLAPLRVLRALELFADGRPRLLGGDQLAQLVERHPEQLLEPQDLAQPLDVGLRVLAMRARRPPAGRLEQPDLLVVADRPRRGAHELGDVADAHQSPYPTATAASARAVRGRSSDTPAPTSDVAASTHSAVCMFWMNG